MALMFSHNPRTMGRPSSGFGRLLGGLFRVQWTGDFLTGQTGESLTGPDNIKRVARLYRKEGLAIRTKTTRRRRAAVIRETPA